MQPRQLCMIALVLGLRSMAVAADAPAPAEAQLRAPSENPLAAQPLDHWSATRDRPLFSPTRRPPPPPPPPVAERIEPPPEIPPRSS
jgi:general secretion pathway protein N